MTLEKPHLFRLGGLWYCRLPNYPWTVYGLGYTPKQAYDDLVNLHG